MRKRTWWLAGFVVMAMVLAACGGRSPGAETAPGAAGPSNTGASGETTKQQKTGQAGGGTITLKVADSLPDTHTITVQGFKFFARRVEELTSGQVKFQHFPNNQLGTAKDMLRLTSDGVTDIAYIGPSYVGTLPLSTVAELPGAFNTAVEGARAFHRLVTGYLLDKEYLRNGVRPLFVVVLPPYELWNTKREVKSFSDAKGLKIRTAGGAMDMTIRTIGAVPIASPPSEIYEALQRGTMDGSVLAPSSVKPYKVDELLKFGTVGANLGSFVAVYSVNENVWQRLPDDIKKAMQKAGWETTEHLAQVFDSETEKLNQEFASRGIKLYRLTPEQQREWAAALRPVWVEWAKALEAKSLPSQEVIAEFEKLLRAQ